MANIANTDKDQKLMKKMEVMALQIFKVKD